MEAGGESNTFFSSCGRSRAMEHETFHGNSTTVVGGRKNEIAVT